MNCVYRSGSVAPLKLAYLSGLSIWVALLLAIKPTVVRGIDCL
jgi:hypothetical protein